MQETVLELSAKGGRIAAGGGRIAGGPFAAGLIAGGLFASGLNAATLHNCCGPGLGLIIQFAGRARVYTTAAGPCRAWDSNRISGRGRAAGPGFQARAGP